MVSRNSYVILARPFAALNRYKFLEVHELAFNIASFQIDNLLGG